MTELVYLLSDRPLSLVHQAVIDAEADEIPDCDPWLLVASALERLQTMTEASLHDRYMHRRLAEPATLLERSTVSEDQVLALPG